MGDPGWLEFVESHPGATPFHLPAWATLIADCYRFEAFVLAMRDTDGEILAGVPTVAVRSPLGRLRWVSLPFSDSCPVLVRHDVAAADVAQALREYALAGPARELEVRTSLPEADDVHPVEVGYDHLAGTCPETLPICTPTKAIATAAIALLERASRSLAAVQRRMSRRSTGSRH